MLNIDIHRHHLFWYVFEAQIFIQKQISVKTRNNFTFYYS